MKICDTYSVCGTCKFRICKENLGTLPLWSFLCIRLCTMDVSIIYRKRTAYKVCSFALLKRRCLCECFRTILLEATLVNTSGSYGINSLGGNSVNRHNFRGREDSLIKQASKPMLRTWAFKIVTRITEIGELSSHLAKGIRFGSFRMRLDICSEHGDDPYPRPTPTSKFG